MKKIMTLISLSTLMISCTQLGSRYFGENLDEGQASFYRPHEDFYVVNGDTGAVDDPVSENGFRAPASLENRVSTREDVALAEELRSLEERENRSSFENYQKHKAKLGSVSERIYYLKLPQHERRGYLESRGISDPQDRPLAEHEKYFGLRPTTIGLGMSKDDVVTSFGRPLRVEVAGNPRYENERWIYNVNGATKYIYFESGRVEGWE